MSDGFDFLTAACRAWLGTGHAKIAPDPGIDPAALEQAAFVHGLEPLLHFLIERGALETEGLAPALTGRWEKAYYQNHVFNTEALAALARLEAGWRTAGLSTVVFKGPAAIARGWGEPALRPMVDLDVLCRERELPELVEIASAEGFEAGGETSVYHLELTNRELALGLELHFDLYDFLPRRRELHARLLAGGRALELEGVSFRALARAEALAMNVAHLVNHDFRVGLRGFLDLAVLSARTPSPSPPTPPPPPPTASEVAAAIARFGLEPELALAGALVERWFGIAVPGAEPWGEDAKRIETAMRRAPVGRAALEEVGARPGLWTKLRYLVRLLFPPRRRLALAGEPGGRRHLAARWRSGLRHFRTAGSAIGRVEGSIKRRVYERRRSRGRRASA